LKDVEQRLKKEQARARKITEERDEMQRKCKAAVNALEAQSWQKRIRTTKNTSAGERERGEENTEGEQRGARQEERTGRGERKEKTPPRRRASAKRRRRPAKQNVQSNSSTRTKSWLRK
jgi:hypothetical protein